MLRQRAVERVPLLGTEGVREFEAVGNGLRAVPVRSVAPRNGTEAVPYSGFQRFEFPDTLCAKQCHTRSNFDGRARAPGVGVARGQIMT